MWMRNYRFSPCDFQCVGCLKTERWKAWACLWKRHQWTRKIISSLFNMPSLFIFGSKFILPPIYDDFSLNFLSLTHTHKDEAENFPLLPNFIHQTTLAKSCKIHETRLWLNQITCLHSSHRFLLPHRTTLQFYDHNELEKKEEKLSFQTRTKHK